MQAFSVHTSSLKLRESSSKWVNASDFNASERVNLLEAEDTVLGKQFIPLRSHLDNPSLTDTEIIRILDQGNQLASTKNSILTQGMQLLFRSHREKLNPIIRQDAGRWPAISPFVLRKDSLSDRTKFLDSILKKGVGAKIGIEACRLLGTPLGASHLADFLDGDFKDLASTALATLPHDEIPLEVELFAASKTKEFPILGAVISKKLLLHALTDEKVRDMLLPLGYFPIETSDVSKATNLIEEVGYLPQTDDASLFLRFFRKINNSLLAEGVTFQDKVSSLDFDEAEVFEASVAAIRLSALKAVKSRQGRPSGGLKEQAIQRNLAELLTPAGARNLLFNFSAREVQDLFAAQGISTSEKALTTICLFDRCRVALIDDQGAFEESFFRYIGKWNWVSEELKSKNAIQVASELKELDKIGEQPQIGEIICSRGFLSDNPSREINSIDIVCSIAHSSKPESEVFKWEELAMKSGLPSLGIEIQNFDIPIEHFYAWKDFLTSHGIRSPWRPEFGSLVEASLPPFFNLDNLELVLDELQTRGFFPEPESPKLAVHVSMGLPTTEDLKYIALGFLSVFPVEFNPQTPDKVWLDSLMNVFSKGLIYKNPGTRPVHPLLPSGDSHAEIRVIAIQGETDINTFRSEFHKATRAAQILGRELTGGIPSPKYERYSDEIKRAHEKCGLNLLESKWVFGTGDPENGKTLEHVPMVGALMDYRRATFLKPQAVREFHHTVREAFLGHQ